MSKKLKKKCWDYFSKYIRRKYADRDGYVTCITCGEKRQWNDRIDAGHYITRGRLSTMFDERNVHPQCKGCNGYGGGRLDVYALYLIKTYGKNILKELNEQKNRKNFKIKDFEYHDMIDDLKDKLVALDIRDIGNL